MKIRCKVCGEYFLLDEETLELMSEGFITSDSVNTCAECWDMLNHLYDDLADMIVMLILDCSLRMKPR